MSLPRKTKLLAIPERPETHRAWAEEELWKRRGVRYYKE